MSIEKRDISSFFNGALVATLIFVVVIFNQKLQQFEDTQQTNRVYFLAAETALNECNEKLEQL